ncbi:hypothetical protein ACWD6R_21475 [Streptomyces sp. NPDC005151]
MAEDRQSIKDFAGETDFSLPFPSPHDVLEHGDPTRDEDAAGRLMAAFTHESGLAPQQLGERLRSHRLTAAVLEILDDRPRTLADVLEGLPRYAYHWGMAVQQRPKEASDALARYISLLSMARDPKDPGRPLLSIEIHHWVRSVSRVLRGVGAARAEFRWDDERIRPLGTPVTTPTSGPDADAALPEPADERPAEPAGDSAAPPAQTFLPAIFCRECGRSGWAALSPEADPAALDLDAGRIRRASVGRDKRRVRNMIAATSAEAYRSAFAREPVRSGSTVMRLDAAGGRLVPLSPEADFEPPRDGSGEPRAPKALRDAAFVVVDPTGDRAAEQDRCPACRTVNSIRYLGTGLAALAAASLTQLFTGGELDKDLGEDKTLLFNDSVQDAAHRAGYVASRSYTFSLRSLIARRIDEDTPIALNDLAADIIEEVADRRDVRAAVIPPDLHVVKGVDTTCSVWAGQAAPPATPTCSPWSTGVRATATTSKTRHR